MPDTASAKVFPGNVDSTSLVKNLLDNPVDARYVRFVVQSWHDHIAMRVEILGCNTTLLELVPPEITILGEFFPVSSNIELSQVESAYVNKAKLGTPHAAFAVCKLSVQHLVGKTRVGHAGHVFPGNFDATYPVTNLLYNPVDARYVRFVVQSWRRHIAMRVEILGCNTSEFQHRPDVGKHF
uniref:F5/8 type C domain-containing protein n=1 Tax=Branchiostoma floridae TaxID=7739 RepID=C3YRT4_BRAFL|eukprot:XP_002600827.1 hypothetical protein BRAFLDRAFT_75882 [Branchiostoma floridae]